MSDHRDDRDHRPLGSEQQQQVSIKTTSDATSLLLTEVQFTEEISQINEIDDRETKSSQYDHNRNHVSGSDMKTSVIKRVDSDVEIFELPKTGEEPSMGVITSRDGNVQHSGWVHRGKLDPSRTGHSPVSTSDSSQSSNDMNVSSSTSTRPTSRLSTDVTKHYGVITSSGGDTLRASSDVEETDRLNPQDNINCHQVLSKREEAAGYCSSNHDVTSTDDHSDHLMGVDDPQQSIYIPMIDDASGHRQLSRSIEGTYNSALRHDDEMGSKTRNDNYTNERRSRNSLARQLERRMSAIPGLFGRRRSKQCGDLDKCRRCSVHGSFPPLKSFSLDEIRTPIAAVAGVGGTITTVTKDTRKTVPLPRLVAKNGTVNLFLDNIDRRQYVRDLFTTMIDIKWRYNLMAAAFGFVFSWLLFACIWYIVLYVHDDLAHENDPTWSPCIVNVYSFSAALLFSIETQSTLGFGSRIISVECPGAIGIFCVQLIFGVVVECLIVGMVFAKLSRPAKRSQTIMYSKYATVCLREGRMCLTFRVGDVRSKSHIIGATIRASIVSQKTTKEGEINPFHHSQLDVKIDDCNQALLLIWPLTIVHEINEQSQLYQFDSEQLAKFKFEIITVLEGTVESTGQSIQVRSSYLPSEVKWGYRFEPIVSTHGHGRYAQTIIDYNKFNRIIEADTPTCSPMDYYSSQNVDQVKDMNQRETVLAFNDNMISDLSCDNQ